MQRNDIIVTRSHVLPGFTHDIDIIGNDRRAVEEAFVPFEMGAARIGFAINISQTNYIIADRHHGSHGDVDREVVENCK